MVAKVSIRFLAMVAALLLSSALAKPSRAGSLSADTIGLFPKNTGEFAYADLKKARTMPWYPALQEQMLPERFRQFENFSLPRESTPIPRSMNCAGVLFLKP